MAVAQLPLSIDQAVEFLWARVLAGDYANVDEAAAGTWETLDLESSDVDWLARLGLASLAAREQHERRSRAQPPRGLSAPHPSEWDEYLGLAFPYMGADGRQRRLLDFTREDWTAFVSAWERNEMVARRRVELGRLALTFLDRARVDATNLLPEDRLRELDAEARLATMSLRAAE